MSWWVKEFSSCCMESMALSMVGTSPSIWSYSKTLAASTTKCSKNGWGLYDSSVSSAWSSMSSKSSSS
jgi:hypothetical protein